MKHASVAQLVEQGTENPRVVGSIPIGGTTKCGFSSFGRARPCQGRGGGFEPRNPLQNGYARYCRTRNFLNMLPERVADNIKVVFELGRQGGESG